MIYGIHHDSIAGYDPYQHIVNNQIRYNNTGVLCATIGSAGELTCAGKLIATDCFYLINPQSLGQSKPTVIQCYNDRDEYEFRADVAGQLQLNMVTRGSGTEEEPLPDYSTGTFFNIWANGRDANSTTWEKMLFGYAAFAGDPDPPSVRRFAFVAQNSLNTNILPIEISAGPIGTNHLVVTNTGAIGIGTFAPGYKLDVQGTLGCLSATIDSFTLDEESTPTRLSIYSAETSIRVGLKTVAGYGMITYDGINSLFLLSRGVTISGAVGISETLSVTGRESRGVTVITGVGNTLGASHNIVLLNGNAGPCVATLPVSPTAGQTYTVKSVDATNTCILSGGGKNIDGSASKTLALNVSYTVVYVDSFYHWRIIDIESRKKTSRYTTTHDTDSAGFTATLPAGENGQELRIINVGSSGNTAVIAPNGTDNIYGANSNVNLYDSEAIILTYETTEGWW
jgi:hypothetical protein